MWHWNISENYSYSTRRRHQTSCSVSETQKYQIFSDASPRKKQHHSTTVCISSGSILVRWEEFLSIVVDVGGWRRSRNVRKISNKWFRRTNVPRFQLTWRHFSSYHTETLEVLQANSDFSTKTSIAFPRCCNTLSQHLTVLWKKASGCSIDRRRPPSRSLRLSELGKKDFKVNL